MLQFCLRYIRCCGKSVESSNIIVDLSLSFSSDSFSFPFLYPFTEYTHLRIFGFFLWIDPFYQNVISFCSCISFLCSVTNSCNLVGFNDTRVSPDGARVWAGLSQVLCSGSHSAAVRVTGPPSYLEAQQGKGSLPGSLMLAHQFMSWGSGMWAPTACWLLAGSLPPFLKTTCASLPRGLVWPACTLEWARGVSRGVC